MSKRPSGDGHPRLRQDGRWEVQLRLPERRSVYGKTQREALAKSKALKARAESGLSIDPAQKFEPYAVAWLSHASGTLRGGAYDSYESLLRLHAYPVIGKVRMDAIRVHHIKHLQDKALADGLAPSTIIRLRSAVRRVLRQGQIDGLLSINPVSLVDPPKVERREYQWFDLKDARRFVELSPGERIDPIVVFAVMTGLRPGELAALKWDAIDVQRRCLHVRYTLSRRDGEVVLRPPKSKLSRRIVPLVRDAIHALWVWKRHWCVANEGGFIFATPAGAPMRTDVFNHQFHRVLERRGLPQMRPHDLRHSFASIMFALGVPLKTVSEILGHSSIRLTGDTYAHLDLEGKREAMDKLSASRTGSALKAGDGHRDGQPALRRVV